MTAAELKHVSKSFPGVQALQDVSMKLEPGRIHALVGENGAGKSTLINILSGVLHPDSGEVCINGKPVHFTDPRHAHRLGVAVVHQELDLFPDLTVAENIGLEQGLPTKALFFVDWQTVRRRALDAIHLVRENLSSRLLASALSPAQRQMVLIAAAVSESALVLILDEPTSSLSEKETKVLFHHLRRFRAHGTAILYVTHRLEEIFELADEVTVLRDGCYVWTGPIEESHPDDLIQKMVGRAIAAKSADQRRIDKSHDSPLFCCEGLTAVDGTIHDVNVAVRAGEILGLYGLIGAGRSEWAQAVFGLRAIKSGTITLDGKTVAATSPAAMMRHGLAYIPEDRLHQGLCRGLSVLANAVLASLRNFARGPWVARRDEEARTTTLMQRMNVRASSSRQIIGTLSGGNQQKVVVGRWLDCEPRVLILDEPTRGVDVGAKAEIHTLIRGLSEAGRAVILISSDLPEVLQHSDRVGVFREGRLVQFFAPATTSAADIAAAALPAEKKTGERQPKSESHWRQSLPHPREAALFLFFLIFIAVLEMYSGKFLTTVNIDLILTSAALLSFTALGAAVVILAGGIDISTGRLMALSAGVAAYLWEVQGWPAAAVCLIAILVGTSGGLLNAALSLWGRVHPIVVTLAMMSVYHGLVQWQIGGIIVISHDRDWILTNFYGIPLLARLAAAALVSVWLFLVMTRGGREVYALGSNPQAARRIGIEPKRVWLRAFGLQGALVGYAGFLWLNYVGSVETTSFEDITLQSIAAAVVGGVAITGGRGSVWGVIVGCLFLASLQPACSSLGIHPTWKQTVVGAVMAVAVTVDALWRRPGN